MKKFLTQKKISPLIALLFVIAAIAGTMGIAFQVFYEKPEVNPMDTLYSQAVKDAMTIEAQEIMPVVKLIRDNKLVTFNGKNEVLLATWNNHPEKYVAGSKCKLDKLIWTFTDKEMLKWYKNNKVGVKDWKLRFEQLLGLPQGTQYKYFSAMWVPVEKIKRPAYSYDVRKEVTDIRFDSDSPNGANNDFVNWFNSNIISSYFEGYYPWTRLGYTYDWAEDSGEYGLSEFLVEKDTEVNIKFTYTTEDFIKWLEEQSN